MGSVHMTKLWPIAAAILILAQKKKRIIAQFFALCTLEHIVNTVALKCKQKQNLDLVG